MDRWRPPRFICRSLLSDESYLFGVIEQHGHGNNSASDHLEAVRTIAGGYGASNLAPSDLSCPGADSKFDPRVSCLRSVAWGVQLQASAVACGAARLSWSVREISP
jgi:hypothetical protein